jgi:cation diffusion facilitator family transporter
MQEDGSRRAIVAAFLANLGIAIAKFVAFLATGAASMLAEAVHSLADTGNQGLLILGAARAKQEATLEHPFGFGRERYFWAFVVAMVLFSLGSVFAIYQGIDKLRHPHEVESPAVAIGILLLAIALESWSFRTAIVAAQSVRGSKSWWSFIRRSKSPELPVVLLEDFGALLGLVIALVGVTLAAVLGDSRFDAIGSIAIGVLLSVIAVVLAIEMKSLLIGESAATEIREAIQRTIEEFPAVRNLIHMRTLHLGPDELLVAVKVEFDTSLDLPRLASAIDDLEAAIRRGTPIAEVIYVEPDIARSASA